MKQPLPLLLTEVKHQVVVIEKRQQFKPLLCPPLAKNDFIVC